jgi:hypothetical protein
MAFYQSKLAAARTPVFSGAGAMQVVPVFADFDLSAALAQDDIIEMLPIPAGYVPVDGILAVDELDTGVDAITLDVGILSALWLKNSASSTIGAQFLAASTVGQAGGAARFAVKAGFLLTPTDTDRAIGIKVAAGPGTGATTGKVRLTAFLRPVIEGA